MQKKHSGLGRCSESRKRPWLMTLLGSAALLGACDGMPSEVEQNAGEVTTGEEVSSLAPDVTPRCVTIKEGGATSCKDEKTWRSYGEASCKSKSLALKSVTFANSCGMASWREATYTCCDSVTPPPPPPPPPDMCITETLSTAAGICIDDGSWKIKAEAFCKSKGLSVKNLSFGLACRTGHIDVKVECCGATPPPPPPPPPGMCFSEVLKDATGACTDDGVWKTRAEAVCKAKGASVRSLGFGTPCRTGHLDVKVECCGATPPPPPPPPPVRCEWSPVPGAGVCRLPDVWKREAVTLCSTKMRTLNDLKLDRPCAMGGFGSAQAECCDSVMPPPPPPPPSTCVSSIVGDGMSCQSEMALKTEADKLCSSRGLKLTAFGGYDPCGALSQFRHAKFTCCK